MAQTSWPFDSIDTTETQFSQWARNIGEGVKGAPTGTELKPYGDSTGMLVKVPAGQALVRGHYYANDAIVSLAVTTAHATLPRIDSVVLTLDPSLNTCVLAVVAGTANASPVAPTLTQTDAAVYQIRLGNIAVAAAVSTITAGNVTDTRPFLNMLKLTAGTALVAPLTLTSGTNLTTASGGAIEYDGTVSYSTPNASATSGRAVVPAAHYYHMNGNYAYTPSLTNATFNSSGTALTLAANTLYEVEAIVRYQFAVSTTATASTTKLNFTGTFSSVESSLTYNYSTSTVGFSTGTTNQGQASVPVNGVVNTVASTTSSNVYCTVLIKGSVRTTTSGALQLQTIYSQLTGLSATVTIGSSYMKVTPIGSAGSLSLGAWA